YPGPVFTLRNTPKPAPFSVPSPEILPQRTRLWAGALAIRIDPLYETTVRTSSPAVAAERKNEDRGSGNADPEGARSLLLDPLSPLLGQSPWGAQQPDYIYSFREKPVSGSLELRPRSPRVRAHCTSEIVLAAGRAAVLTR